MIRLLILLMLAADLHAVDNMTESAAGPKEQVHSEPQETSQCLMGSLRNQLSKNNGNEQTAIPVEKCGESLAVRVEYELLGISKQDSNNEAEVELVLHLKWIDSRRKWEQKDKNLTVITLKKKGMWVPKLRIHTSVSTILEDQFVRVNSNGAASYSVIVKTRARCATDWSRFPRDSTVCKIGFEGVEYFQNEMYFGYRSDDDDKKEKEVMSHMQIDNGQWNVRETDFRLADVKDGASEAAGFEIFLVLDRNQQYYNVHLFAPTTALTMIQTIATFSPWDHGGEYYGKIFIEFVTISTISVQPIIADVPKTLHLNVLSSFFIAQLALAVCTTLLYVLVVNITNKCSKDKTRFPDLLRRCLFMEKPAPPAAAPRSDIGHDRYTNETLKALGEIQDAILANGQPSELELEWQTARRRLQLPCLVIFCVANVAAVLALLISSSIGYAAKDDLMKLFAQH